MYCELQVEGKTDENSLQVLAMLGETFHEAQQLLTELAAKTQSHRSASPSLQSSLHLSQDSQAKTFHSSALKSSDTETVVSTSTSLVNSTVGQSHDDQLAILSATKDMLQPFVSQLSHDLSRGIIKYIKEKVDESENPSIV